MSWTFEYVNRWGHMEQSKRLTNWFIKSLPVKLWQWCKCFTETYSHIRDIATQICFVKISQCLTIYYIQNKFTDYAFKGHGERRWTQTQNVRSLFMPSPHKADERFSFFPQKQSTEPKSDSEMRWVQCWGHNYNNGWDNLIFLNIWANLTWENSLSLLKILS